MRFTQLLMSRMGKWSKHYANLPDRYIERVTEQVYWKNPKGPQYRQGVVVKRKRFNFGVDRPWTQEFQLKNAPGTPVPKVFVEPIKEWSFFRGDRVQVLTGKDKGKQGIVMQIFEESNWVIVEGLNCELKCIGKDKTNPGVYIKNEQPLLVTSEVALVDPSDLAPTEIEWRFTEDGENVRVSTRTGRIIPMPPMAEETIDYKTKGTYLEQPKDTPAKAVTEITFKPQLKTFEMEIMENMGIKEDRIPPPTYWY